jgi:hypothetical protein
MWSAASGTPRFYDPLMEGAGEPRAARRCLCGSLTYEVRGPQRDSSSATARSAAGGPANLGAFTSTREEHLVLIESAALGRKPGQRPPPRSAGSAASAGRASSGSRQAASGSTSLRARSTVRRAFGSRVTWYTRQAGDFGVIPDDGLPRDAEFGATEIRWS